MQPEEIQRLVEKYLKGEATQEEEQFIEAWFAAIGKHADKQSLTDIQRIELKNRYWSAISQHLKNHRRGNIFSIHSWKAAAIAASFTLLVAFGIFNIVNNKESITSITTLFSDNDAFQVFDNRSAEIRQVWLDDSTLVALRPGASLKVAVPYARINREVYLKGEAFFKVAHNPSKPFFVYSNDIVTRVLGTSFTVSAEPNDKNVTVSVRTGKVSVYKKDADNTVRASEDHVILVPNQQAIYDIEAQALKRTLVDDPIVIKENNLEVARYEEAPLPEILAQIEDMYGVQIKYDTTKFTNCKLTTYIDFTERLSNKLDAICQVIGATYIVDDGHILIEGEGCDETQTND